MAWAPLRCSLCPELQQRAMRTPGPPARRLCPDPQALVASVLGSGCRFGGPRGLGSRVSEQE